MDETTLPSFAVSSLCAATASCSAASLGYAWATTGEEVNSSSTNSLTPVNTTNSILRPSTSFRRTDSTRAASQRPHSAVIHSVRDTSWALSPAPANGARTSHQSFHSATPVESLQEAETEEEAGDTGVVIGPKPSPLSPRRRTSTWFRKRRPLGSVFSPTTPSPAETERTANLTSTPSIYTNASNTPFLPTPSQPFVSRNRLVKRSTSLSLHNRSSLDTPSTSNNSTLSPVFRRPATSHQRSIETRIQSLRHQPSRSSAATTPARPSGDGPDPDRQVLDPRGWRWRSFFRRSTVRVKDFGETAIRDPANIFLTKKDEITCIIGSRGDLPTLVMAASVSTRSSDHDFVTPTVRKTHTHRFSEAASVRAQSGHRMSQFREELPEPSSSAHRTSRDGNSMFPMAWVGSNTSSPTPATFKVFRRRSAKRANGAAGGEVVGSKSILRSNSDNNIDPARRFTQSSALMRQSIAESGGDAEQGWWDRAHGDRLQHVRSFSQVSPPFHDNLPNEVSNSQGLDGNVNSMLKDDHQTLNGNINSSFPLRRHSHSSDGALNGYVGQASLLSSANLSSANARVLKANRVVSDQGSAAGGGSDTDNSRVFSINGEDVDGFSDTNYDSLRTGGTSSSNSGTRSTRIDSVFLDSNKDVGFNGDVLSVLEEKLSDASLSSSSRLGLREGTPSRLGAAAEFGSGSQGDKMLSSTNTPTKPHQIARTGRAGSYASFSTDLDFLDSSPYHNSFSQQQQQQQLPAQAIAQDQDSDSFWDSIDFHAASQSRDMTPLQLSRSLFRSQNSPNLSFSLSENQDDIPNIQDSPRLPSTPSLRPGKIDLWAYSEHNPANILPDARPQTVHGKNTEIDGHRVSHRRVTHHRSHSEPKVADDMKPYSPEMFQLGKRGASENWDSDFEDQWHDPVTNMAVAFDRPEPVAAAYSSPPPASPGPVSPVTAPSTAAPGTPTIAPSTTETDTSKARRPPSASTLAIPSYISNLQNTVRGQYKAVGELKMLVEELRRLMIYAEKLDIKVTRRAKDLCEEALGIIQLADAPDNDALNAWKDPLNPVGEVQPGSPDKHDPGSLGQMEQQIKRKTEISPPTSMAEAIVKNMAAAKPDSAVGTKKTNFDTMALKELVGRASACVSNLKAEILTAEGGGDRNSPAVNALKDVFKSP